MPKEVFFCHSTNQHITLHFSYKVQNLVITTECGCSPHDDDVLLGTLPGVAGQRVTHRPIPLFGWQAAVQVKTGVDVCCWVQLKDTHSTLSAADLHGLACKSSYDASTTVSDVRSMLILGIVALNGRDAVH